MNKLFPANPAHETIYKDDNGVYFQYNEGLKNWIELTNNSENNLVTQYTDGLMLSSDYIKLNKLLLPSPVSTIKSEKCDIKYESGIINMYGDNFIDVSGISTVKNIDEFGDSVRHDIAFNISEHVSGFDFKINMDNIITELYSRNQINIVGPKGDKGFKGKTGDDGFSNILSGPKGDKGDNGSAPNSNITILPEEFRVETRYDLKKGLVDVHVVADPTDNSKFKLVFDRQAIGKTGFSTYQFNTVGNNSQWVLVTVTNLPNPQDIYYIDISPIITSIHNKFLSEIDKLKTGYENIVNHWLGSMIKLFDESKESLCCALQFCISKTKNAGLRQHMESVAAAAAGSARIVLNNRYSDESVELSPTRLMKDLGQADICEFGPPFPQVGPDDYIQVGGNWVSNSGSGSSSNVTISPFKSTLNTDVNKNIVVLPHFHNNQVNGYKFDLDRGKYLIEIYNYNCDFDGQFKCPLVIEYFDDNVLSYTSFIDKGVFNSLLEAKYEYDNLNVTLVHSGGQVNFYFNGQYEFASGEIVLSIKKVGNFVENIDNVTHTVSSNELFDIQNKWLSGNCDGFVINIDNQEYLITKFLKFAVCIPILNKVDLLYPADGLDVASDGELQGFVSDLVSSGNYYIVRNCDNFLHNLPLILFPYDKS